MATKEKTAAQLAAQMKQVQLNSIDKHLRIIEKKLTEVEPLIEMRDRLRAQRRALLNERGTTASGGKGLTQAEVVKAMQDHGEAITVDALAKLLSAGEAQVRGHLNRGRDERFTVEDKGGVKMWSVRDPEDEEEDDDDDD